MTRKFSVIIIFATLTNIFGQDSIKSIKPNISATVTLQSLAEDKRLKRQIGYFTITILGLGLFSIGYEDPSLEDASIILGTITTGIGITGLVFRSKAERKYKSLENSSTYEQKEELAYNHLIYLSDEAKRIRKMNALFAGALCIYHIVAQPYKEYEYDYSDYGIYEETEKNSPLNLYYGLIWGASALFDGTVLSKEEKALKNYINQTP